MALLPVTNSLIAYSQLPRLDDSDDSTAPSSPVLESDSSSLVLTEEQMARLIFSINEKISTGKYSKAEAALQQVTEAALQWKDRALTTRSYTIIDPLDALHRSAEMLGCPYIQANKVLKYLIARSINCFLELGCMKFAQLTGHSRSETTQYTMYPETRDLLNANIAKATTNLESSDVELSFELKYAEECAKRIGNFTSKDLCRMLMSYKLLNLTARLFNDISMNSWFDPVFKISWMTQIYFHLAEADYSTIRSIIEATEPDSNSAEIAYAKIKMLCQLMLFSEEAADFILNREETTFGMRYYLYHPKKSGQNIRLMAIQSLGRICQLLQTQQPETAGKIKAMFVECIARACAESSGSSSIDDDSVDNLSADKEEMILLLISFLNHNDPICIDSTRPEIIKDFLQNAQDQISQLQLQIDSSENGNPFSIHNKIGLLQQVRTKLRALFSSNSSNKYVQVASAPISSTIPILDLSSVAELEIPATDTPAALYEKAVGLEWTEKRVEAFEIMCGLAGKHPDAYYKLAEYYLEGMGTAVNTEAAKQWANKATKGSNTHSIQPDTRGYWILGYLHTKNQDFTSASLAFYLDSSPYKAFGLMQAKFLNKEPIEEGEKEEVVAGLTTLADKGDITAMRLLWWCHNHLSDATSEEQLMLLERACVQQSPRAMASYVLTVSKMENPDRAAVRKALEYGQQAVEAGVTECGGALEALQAPSRPSSASSSRSSPLTNRRHGSRKQSTHHS